MAVNYGQLLFGRRILGMYRIDKEVCMATVLTLLAQNGGREGSTDLILWIIAAVLVIAGIVTLVRGGVVLGIILIIAGLLVGPGGVSLFD
jgi:hypothetical protein